ncbi:hypothetical protein ACQP2P_15695 [Dactylosporangium sp. CA-139114]|uniref:hypothetical protein n=1 Tax=Dactylosporangium sp. CA-139114 TaxID=3239931 RepID=UPI003D9759E7
MSALYTGLCLVADGVALDTDDRGDMPVGADHRIEWRALDAFPPASWRQGARWRRRLAARGKHLIRTLEVGGGLVAECVVDYLVHHLAIDRARDEIYGARSDPDHPSHHIPAHPADFLWHRLPYSSPLGDHDALCYAPNHIAMLHRSYRATIDRPEQWFDPIVPPATLITEGGASRADESN